MLHFTIGMNGVDTILEWDLRIGLGHFPDGNRKADRLKVQEVGGVGVITQGSSSAFGVVVWFTASAAIFDSLLQEVEHIVWDITKVINARLFYRSSSRAV
jgi:hypothetical protein